MADVVVRFRFWFRFRFGFGFGFRLIARLFHAMWQVEPEPEPEADAEAEALWQQLTWQLCHLATSSICRPKIG